MLFYGERIYVEQHLFFFGKGTEKFKKYDLRNKGM